MMAEEELHGAGAATISDTRLNVVTGATGLIGGCICRALLSRGRTVRALVRDVAKAKDLLPSQVELFEGDVTDVTKVDECISGASVVYHCAGIPEQWLADSSLFEKVNVGGTKNVISACLKHKVDKLVYTSTQDVFTQWPGENFDESEINPSPDVTPYRISKQHADKEVVLAVREKSLPAVFCHPSAVFGPYPSSSPTLNQFMVNLLKGDIPMVLPGCVNVILGEDCAAAHIAAADIAEVGDRFLISESTQDLVKMARQVYIGAGRANARLPPVCPRWIAKVVASVSEGVSTITNEPPAVQKGQLRGLFACGRADNRKMKQILGVVPSPFSASVQKTIKWMYDQNMLRPPGDVGNVRWVDDDASSTCSACNVEFGTFTRRHHCRKCGGLFCDDCSKRRAPIPSIGAVEAVRVCDLCADILGGPSTRGSVITKDALHATTAAMANQKIADDLAASAAKIEAAQNS